MAMASAALPGNSKCGKTASARFVTLGTLVFVEGTDRLGNVGHEAQHEARDAVHHEKRSSAATPPMAMPMGVASPMAALSRPMARPIFSSGTLRCVRVIVGPLNHAQAMAITATSTTKATKPVGGRSPHAAVVAPTMTAATAISPASLLPPPHAMSMPEPTSMPMPNAASTSEAM